MRFFNSVLVVVAMLVLAVGECFGEMRKWRLTDGQILTAEFVSADESEVQLKRASGSVETVKRELLNEADQKLVAELVAKEEAGGKKGIAEQLKGKLVALEGTKLVDFDASRLSGLKYCFIWFVSVAGEDGHKSVGRIVRDYVAIKSQEPNTELILVPTGGSEADLRDFAVEYKFPGAIVSLKAAQEGVLKKYKAYTSFYLAFVNVASGEDVAGGGNNSYKTALAAKRLVFGEEATGMRTWKFDDGRKEKRSFSSATEDYVYLRDKDDKSLRFLRSQLCAEDQELVAKLSGVAVSTKTLAERLSGMLVRVSAGEKKGMAQVQRVDDSALKDAKYIAFYFSASWCGPCRKFTPDLVDDYPKLKKMNPSFEVVLVSSDRKQDEMLRYMIDNKMQWSAVDFNKLKETGFLGRYKARGIPNLVFVEAATGKVLSASYDGDSYVGPRSVLSEMWSILKKDAAKK